MKTIFDSPPMRSFSVLLAVCLVFAVGAIAQTTFGGSCGPSTLPVALHTTTGLAGLERIDWVGNGTDVVFAIALGKLYKSVNNGQTWVSQNDMLPAPNPDVRGVYHTDANPRTFYFYGFSGN